MGSPVYIYSRYSKLWPLYLVYDAEIRRRATQLAVDLSIFLIGIWNDLESQYLANRVLTLAQSNSKFQSPSNNNNSTCLRNPSKGSSSQSHQHSSVDSNRTSHCIFCGDTSKSHLLCNCPTSSNIKGTPCHLSRHEQTGSRHSKLRKRYCYSWNGLAGYDHSPCL
jgi:hypothetical protein